MSQIRLNENKKNPSTLQEIVSKRVKYIETKSYKSGISLLDQQKVDIFPNQCFPPTYSAQIRSRFNNKIR